MLYQIISIIGAIFILGAYVALQAGWMTRDDRLFNVVNFIGAVLLAWVAVIDWRVGFVLLESAWAILSIPGMFRRRARTSG